MEVENFTIGCFGGRSDKLKFTRGANGISVRGMAGNASLQGVVLDGSDVKKFDRMIARFQREDRHIQRKMKSDLERGMMVVGTSEGLRISKFQDTLRLSSAEFSGGSGIRDGSNLLTVHELIERMRNQRRAASARNHGVSRSSGPGIILPTP